MGREQECCSNTQALTDSIEHSQGDSPLRLARTIVGLPGHDNRYSAIASSNDAETAKVSCMHVAGFGIDAMQDDPAHQANAEDGCSRYTSCLAMIGVARQ